MKKEMYVGVLILLFISSCKGQNNANLPTGIVSEITNIAAGQQKSVWPPGMDPFINSSCELQDKSGNRWFGTSGGGVYRYDGKLLSAAGTLTNRQAGLTNFTQNDGLSGNIVFCMMQDKIGNIWFGTNRGACFYDGKNFIRFPIPGVDNAGSFLFSESAGIIIAPGGSSLKRAVVRIIQDKAGSIWFGTTEMGLFRYNGNLVSVQRAKQNGETGFTNFRFTCSTCEETPTDTEKYKAGIWRMMPTDSIGYNDGLHLNSIGCLMEDKAGNIWFTASGHGGVYRYDGINFTRFAEYKGFDNTNCFGC